MTTPYHLPVSKLPQPLQTHHLCSKLHLHALQAINHKNTMRTVTYSNHKID